MRLRTHGAIRALQVGLCAILALGFVLAAPVHADLGVTRPTFVKKLSRFPADVAKRHGIKTGEFKEITSDQFPQGSLISFPDLGVVYQVWTIANHPELAEHSIIAERKLGSLDLMRSIVVPYPIKRANTSLGAEWVNTIDKKNQRIIFEVGHNAILTTDTPGLLILDGRSFTYRFKEFPQLLVRNRDAFQAVMGLEYDEEADQVVMLVAGLDNNPTFTANTLMMVGWKNAELMAEGPLPGLGGMLGPRYMRNCRRDAINIGSSPRLSPIMIAKGPDLDSTAAEKPVKTWYVFPCHSTSYSVNVLLIRISRENALNPTSTEEKAIPAPAGIAHWAKDDSRGRLFLLNATQEVDAWVYEVASNAFIGIIEMTPKGETNAASVGLGVDERSGRLYGYGLGFGIMIAEADQDPVPQADTYDAGPDKESGQANIAVDPDHDQIMFIRGYGVGSWRDYIEVWRVPTPLHDQERPDRDKLTAQVDEKEGVTTAEFGGVASAYGARILLAGGVAGIPPNNGNDNVGSLYQGLNSRCAFHDRELVLGFVPSTELSESIVDARAESVRMDDNGIKDFGEPSRCDAYYTYAGPAPQIFPQILRDNLFFASLFTRGEQIRRATGLDQQLKTLGVYDAFERQAQIKLDRSLEEHTNDQARPHTKWEYEAAYCAAPYYPNDRPGNNSARFADETLVNCDSQTEVSAKAEGHATAALGAQGKALPIRIGRASSFTKVYLDPKLGLVSEATARVENVQIGTVSIGFIENRARSYAHGRTGTAKTDTYEPTIALVKNGDTMVCASKCSLDDVLPQINTALSGRAEVRRTAPDLILQAGTPGGYEAGIIKSDKQQSSDNALTGDDSRQVPALEVIVYNDNPVLGRARQLVQFAGVRATSNYGIKLIATGDPFGPDPETAPPPPDPTDPQVVTVERQIPGKTVVKRVPVFLGVPGGYRLLLANPRAAGAMATVWLMLISPGIVWLRRRRLKLLG